MLSWLSVKWSKNSKPILARPRLFECMFSKRFQTAWLNFTYGNGILETVAVHNFVYTTSLVGVFIQVN